MRAGIFLLVGLLLQGSPAPVFDSNRAWEHVRQLVAIGPRPTGSPAIEQSRQYIRKQLEAVGVTVTEQAWDAETPAGPVRMVNLIATIAGTDPALKNRLVIGGHYDTKRFSEFRFVGANDGGSSAAFLIEIARVLKARRNALTIDLLFLDGEEAVVEWKDNDHTYGSRHYVEEARRSGTLSSIKAFILVDLIGGRDLQIKRDTNSTVWLTELIWSAAERLNLPAFSDQLTQVEDDHVPFLQAKVPAVDIIDLDYKAWHTPNDTLDAMSPRSLQVVGDALLGALPQLEALLKIAR